jgi:signal transduction histidine kinase
MMKPFLRSFYIAACSIALTLCLGYCMLLKASPAASGGYAGYVAFLLSASLGGAALLSTALELFVRRGGAEARALKARIEEMEMSLHHLEDTASRREEFIASFAHELKTPLTAIIGYADMLRSKDMAPKPRFTAAGYIFSEGKRLEALSLKLMDIIVAGKQSFKKRRFDAGYFIRSVAAVTVPSLSGDGLTLNMRWDNADVEVEPDLFKTLLINLVDNARKASHKGQSVEIFGKREEEGYAFYVQDHGRGMAREDISRIAEPFYMIDKSRSRAQNGAGLGLALCQRIAELHGSALEYESELNEGTTVRIFLAGGENG